MKRRKPLKKKSARQKRIDYALKLLRQILIKKHGSYCMFCGKKDKRVGLFHIKHRSTHKRIILSEENVLLACWFPCHNNWHHDFYKARLMEKKIKLLRGDDFEKYLEILNKTNARLTLQQIEFYIEAFKQELKNGEHNVKSD